MASSAAASFGVQPLPVSWGWGTQTPAPPPPPRSRPSAEARWILNVFLCSPGFSMGIDLSTGHRFFLRALRKWRETSEKRAHGFARRRHLSRQSPPEGRELPSLAILLPELMNLNNFWGFGPHFSSNYIYILFLGGDFYSKSIRTPSKSQTNFSMPLGHQASKEKSGTK